MNITRRDRDRFLSDSDEELAAACTLDFFKSTGRGRQKRNKTSSAVRLIHRPTGLSVTDCSERSQHRNRAAALAKLRLLIAREVRCHPAEAPEPEADDDLPPFDLPDSVESACALRKLDTEDKIRVLEELKSRELPASKSNIKQVVDQILPPSPKIPKLSYGTIRNSIDAIVRQAEFFDSLDPDRIGELFQSPEHREQAVGALKKMVGILENRLAVPDDDEDEENC